jgi:glycerol-3-phosphate O-acyltransferase
VHLSRLSTRALEDEPRWPASGARRIVFLADASSPLERRLLRSWAERATPTDGELSADWVDLPPSRRRRARRETDARLEAALASDDDPLLAPLRVVWLPGLVGGKRTARPSDLLKLGDPRDPGRLRQLWVLARHRDRCRVVAAEPAPVDELRRRWRDAGGSDSGNTASLAEFVARQAALALERAERKLRGARYKVPRLVEDEILDRPAFRGGLQKLARETRLSPARAARRASRYLREIAAAHSPFVIDLVSNLIRRLYTLGYGEVLQYDREQLAGITRLAQRHPIVFLPSHKSNLDHLVLQYMLYEHGLPPNHTAGGINMNFFPVGPLVRRSGVFFIRRSFRDNSIYKHVLRSYIDYLIEKRFNLEWYIEGGRSRSGKLLPPRFGMLAYVVDAFRRGKSDDVYLIPVSIAYDQIQDVGSYSAEARGGAKQAESFGWFLGVIRSLRRRYGNIYIRFGGPISLKAQLSLPDPDAPPESERQSLELQKLAFEVSVRINQATPITPTSLVTLAMLGTGDRALSVSEVRLSLRNLIDLVQARKYPTTVGLDPLRHDDAVRGTLQALVENGVLSCYAEGPEAVYGIGADQHLTAAYYRNTIIHFFVGAAICELSLLHLAGSGTISEPSEAFWDEAMRLRDLFKFEFFFPEKDAFRLEMADELRRQEPTWEQQLGSGPETIQRLVRKLRPYTAHRTVRPFLETYLVVGEGLVRLAPGAGFDEARFNSDCMKLGRQLLLQRRIQSAASISKVLFQTGVRVAEHRGLLELGAPDLVERRVAFAEEIRDALRRAEAIGALASIRRAGLVD